MNLHQFLRPAAEVARISGPQDQIVMSSRVRLARNLVQTPFPGWAKKPDRLKVCSRIREAVEALSQMAEGFHASMEEFSALDKQVLVERHLISREHAAKSSGSGLVVSRDEVLSVMINEEDHLRMQALLPGLQLNRAWQAIDAVDTALESALDYAFSPQLGYLTACPTNVGTGIRVSAMLHLPALVLGEQINQIIQAVNKLGLAVRGLYGEGTEALGNVFQISNQMTLGDSEEEIVERLNKVVAQVIEHETDARGLLLEKKPKSVFNHVGRAYGILANAHSVSSKEAINLLSLFRLGIDLGLFADTPRGLTDELFLLVQPAHLQLTARDKLSAEQRDFHRADLVRGRLEAVPRPRPPAAGGAGTLDKPA
ncbi:MAG: protein arginine kinase [Verrucomicrobiales bacterium]|nr:protein arginine kinase [Verrucomicrobiales bacterium]MCP5525254.1 protein arginine kinase [Verrucomicrobiales bacterium]